VDRRWCRVGLVAAVLVGVGLAAAACSSGPPAASGVATITTVAKASGAKSSGSSSAGRSNASSPTGASANTGGNGNAPEAGFAGNGQGGHSSGNATMIAPAGSVAQAEKFLSCMRSHGVSAGSVNSNGSVEFSGGNVGSPQFQQASQKCRSLLPNGGAPTPAQQAAAVANALKFSECMRSHGITNFPDPQVSGGGSRISIRIGSKNGSSLDPNSPTFQAAQKACSNFLPGGGPGGAAPAKSVGGAAGAS